MKNTVAGTAQADVIMLVVSAELVTQHALIAFAMGIEHLIVVVCFINSYK